ncbi:MAG: 50S ribosomal protein L21 [Elusimicrobia bacterium]|nr:50S ribosomal protein L21 [Elusimicrobiota bacterium]
MYAIIETGGRQYWVQPGETLRVEKLSAEPGKEISLTALWAVGDAEAGSEPEIGLKGTVTAEVVKNLRGPKLIVFKRRTKKAYKKMHGHRQDLTEIRIKSIAVGDGARCA